MIDRIDDLEEMTIELLYWAKDCPDREAAQKMRAAAQLLTHAVTSLRALDDAGGTADMAERGSLLSFLTSRV